MKLTRDGHRITATSAGQWAGEIAFPAVPGREGHVVIERTFVCPQFRHQGLGAKLVRQAVALAKQEHWTVKLMCPFAKMEFSRHHDYNDCLLAADRLD